MALLNQEQSSILKNIICRDFSEINNTCQPRCDRFAQTSHIGTEIYIYRADRILSCNLNLHTTLQKC